MPSRAVFLYWPSGTDVERDEVEEAVEEALGVDGEITGSGAGSELVNLDVEIYEGERSEPVFQRVNGALATVGLPQGAYWKWEHSDTAIPVRAAPDR